MPLTLQEAQNCHTARTERAAKIGAQVTVAVVDEGGHLQALGRMNGAAAALSPDRRDQSGQRRPLPPRRRRTAPDAGGLARLLRQLDRACGRPILAGAGATLIRRADTVFGAMAVSGGMAPGQDDECAEAGLAGLAAGN